MKIVIIDDDLSSLESTVFVLSRLNFDVNQFNNIDTALEFLSNNFEKIDLVFVDERMPQMSGRELGKVITGYEYSHSLPLIMLTAHQEIDFAVDALTECGYDYFIWKNNFDTKQKIEEKILHIYSLPSVKTKKRLKDIGNRIALMLNDLNIARKREYLENFDECVARDRVEEILETVEKRLDLQEKVFTIAAENGIKMVTMYSLAGGIRMLETGRILDGEILRKLTRIENHSEFGLPDKRNSNSYSTLKGYFKKSENGQYTIVALIVFGLFKKSPERWNLTFSIAKQRNDPRHRDDFFTLIDDIIAEL